MNNLEQYYRNLCEQLQAQVELLEKKIEEKKKAKKQVKGKKPAKDKMADKDYDGDGEVERKSILVPVTRPSRRT